MAFRNEGGGWQWTRLASPAAPDGWELQEGELDVAAGDGADALNGGWVLTGLSPDRAAFETEAAGSGLRILRQFSFGPAANVVRIETWVRSLAGPRLLNRIGLLALSVEGESFRTTGPSPASFPVFGEGLFAGIEDVCGESRSEGNSVWLWQTPDLSAGEDWQFVAATVVGWHAPRAAAFLPGESRTRDGFLQYLDTIRLKPEGINLHSDTWWTLPCPFTEADVLKDIAALRTGFYERTGMFFDTYALDLGWSEPRSLWGIDARNFPAGLGRINGQLAALKCRMGMWVSPSSGYAPGLDNQWLETQGYEMTPVGNDEKVACFALGGRYQREFAETLVGYAKEYSLGHVIFDGLVNACHDPAHLHATGVGSTYSIAAGLRDVMNRLRRVNPKMVLEPLTCGHPPSPWWNMHTPFLLGPAGDDVPYGRVPCPDWIESLISARDVAYRSGQESWLVRTQALETFDIIMQSPGVFQNMAAMAAGRGRWFVSANIKPELMKSSDWDFLAAMVRWQRANQPYLVDARMFGGRPEQREAYGYVFHQADKDIYCVRNPWIEERTIQLPARVRDARDLQMIYPRRATLARLLPEEDGPVIKLGPYETVFLETAPLTDNPLTSAPAAAAATVTAMAPEVFQPDPETEEPGFHYSWNGALAVPELTEGELCILLEGPPEVANAECIATVNGRAVRLVKRGSAGQFGAAVEASPENWTWFIAPIAAGDQRFTLDLTVPLAKAAVAVFLRGYVTASSDDAPDEGPAFPLYRADQRPWSQTLQALKEFSFAPRDEMSP